LRTEAAAALAALDLRPVRSIGVGFAVYDPEFSPDGTVLALGGWRAGPDGAGQVRLYDPTTGALLRELTFPLNTPWELGAGRGDGCRVLQYSPDGRWLVVGTRAGRLVRWDLRDPAPQPVVWGDHTDDTLRLQNLDVKSLVFTADSTALYSSNIGVTRRWNIGSGWTPDGRWPSVSAPRGTRAFGSAPVLNHGDPGTWPDLVRLMSPDDRIEPSGVRVFGQTNYAVAPDGRLVAASTPSAELILVAPVPNAVPRPFVMPGRPPPFRVMISDIGFSPDAAILVTAGEHDRRVKVWDVAVGSLTADRVVGAGTGRFGFSPDGRHLAVAEDDRTVLYEVTGRVRQTVGLGPWEWLKTFAIAPDGRTLTTFHYTEPNTSWVTWAVSGNGPPVRVECGMSPDHLTEARVADCSPDGRTIAWVETDQRVERVLTSGDREIVTDRVSDLRFGPDGRLWVADSHRVRVFTFPVGEECPLENDVAAHTTGVVFRAVAPGHRYTLVGRRDGRVYRLAGPSGAAAVWQPLSGPVTALALSADESWAAVGGESGELALLRPADGKVLPVRAAHRDAVRSVAFGPGGWVVSGSADGTIKFWSPSGSPLMTLRAGGEVRKLAVSTDGAVLSVLVDDERGVRQWRLDRLRGELAALGLDWDGEQ
jgi:WD40 repeat protein